ncbi:MAG: hypothetical protein WCR33_01090 [Bacilli bacterium]
MKKEDKEVFDDTCFNVYKGILFHNQNFAEGNDGKINYDFSDPRFEELKDKYNLISIVGKVSEFEKVKRLSHYFAPKLIHESFYDNHIECNSLALLEYSFDNPKQGINCLNKSKILQECCLALKIYARRVFIMPYSPYDMDNHVVNEIYDTKLKKWIMVDLTTDSYFVDENKIPLSLLEIRNKFANDEFITSVNTMDILTNLKKLKNKYAENNCYICKNLAWLSTAKNSKFGVDKDYYFFAPQNFSIKNNSIVNYKYRINNTPSGNPKLLKFAEEHLAKLENSKEFVLTNISVMERKPK